MTGRPRRRPAAPRPDRRPAARAPARRRRRLDHHEPLQGPRPQGQRQARPDAGDRRRHRRRGVGAPHAGPGPTPRRRARRGDVGHRLGPAPLGDRPDRRHQELRPRRPGLGHADLADDQRRGGRRRGQRARPRPALVGQPRRRRVRRQVADVAGRSATSPQVAAIEDASLSYAEIGEWVEAGQGQEFVDLLRTCWRTRAYGDFWSYVLLAEGGVDIACEPELELHDMAACSIVVTEAGGRFTDLDGRPGPARRRRVRDQRAAARGGPGPAAARARRRRLRHASTGCLLAAGRRSARGRAEGAAPDGSGVGVGRRAAEVLLDGGCDRVLVVVGAAGDEVAGPARTIPAGRAGRTSTVVPLPATGPSGMSASLAAGLAAVDGDRCRRPPRRPSRRPRRGGPAGAGPRRPARDALARATYARSARPPGARRRRPRRRAAGDPRGRPRARAPTSTATARGPSSAATSRRARTTTSRRR